jgi:hypothetical protein
VTSPGISRARQPSVPNTDQYITVWLIIPSPAGEKLVLLGLSVLVTFHEVTVVPSSSVELSLVVFVDCGLPRVGFVLPTLSVVNVDLTLVLTLTSVDCVVSMVLLLDGSIGLKVVDTDPVLGSVGGLQWNSQSARTPGLQIPARAVNHSARAKIEICF